MEHNDKADNAPDDSRGYYYQNILDILSPSQWSLPATSSVSSPAYENFDPVKYFGYPERRWSPTAEDKAAIQEQAGAPIKFLDPETSNSAHDPAKQLKRPLDFSALPSTAAPESSLRAMAGKKSGKALLREEGLERTDNGMRVTSWPETPMINQKNYYTEFMKRDDQILPSRLQADENREKMAREARVRDRARNTLGASANDEEDQAPEMGEKIYLDGSDVIVIHLGSQNLRVGFAKDALPKTVPMAIASPFTHNESTKSEGYEPLPTRHNTKGKAEERFGEEFMKNYANMSADLKADMRANKRKVLPNSKDLAISYNKRTPPEKVSEHNDSLRIDWTDVTGCKSDDLRVGLEAQRIPDNSTPLYKLWWPIRHGVVNEKEYWSRERLYNEIEEIILTSLTNELGVLAGDEDEYSCVWVVPDLYDKAYLEDLLYMSMKHLEFKKVAFIQESLAATFGACSTIACIVDVGAQKTSIACVDDGMVIEDSRINLKYGGYDVTELFIKMMLHDSFPYQDINLRRRYDFLLAEELKIAYCTMKQDDISVQTHNFHLRTHYKPTRKYHFKTYDETILAPMGFYDPSSFDNKHKLDGRRKLISRSYNAYDPDMPDDPTSSAQQAILAYVKPSLVASTNISGSQGNVNATPQKEKSSMLNTLGRMDSDGHSLLNSAAASPAPESTPGPSGIFVFGGNSTNSGSPGAPGQNSLQIHKDGSHAGTPAPPGMFVDPLHRTAKELAEERDSILPIAPLDMAILTSVTHAAKGDDKKSRDFLGGIMVIGGGSKIPGFVTFLEERLKAKRPDLADKVLVGKCPRELDAQVVVWKGASVFARMELTEAWITPYEYDRLGPRAMHTRNLWQY